MSLFKKKNKSEVPNYAYSSDENTLGSTNGTLENKSDKASYKWRLIAQEISEIVNK